MDSNRFLKILWTVNGVLLFLCFMFFLIMIGREIFENGSSYEEPEVIVGEELAEAKKEGLILQGLTYGEPEKVYGHPNYLLTVSVKTYNTPKRIQRSFDMNRRSKLMVDHQESRLVNVIFLNMNFEPINVLLKEKAFIHSVEYPIEKYANTGRPATDSLRSLVTFIISQNDSNHDGVLNDEDEADLYVSNCDGSQFSQITKGWNIKSHAFVSREQILIRYTLRTKNEEEEEHKKVLFAVYDTRQKSLKELSDLNKKLDEIEAQVTQ